MGMFEAQIVSETLSTLKARQSKPRDSWFNTRTAWIKMISNGEIDGDKTLRKNYILFNGTNGRLWSKNNISKLSGNNRPAAGIVDLSIEPKNSKGTVKEATINWKCWTLEDLDILEKLYMTPGLTCSVEWGWSHTIDGGSISTLMIDDIPKPSEEFTEKMVKKLKDSNGQQGALQGMVVDFNWSVNDEGGFDCTTKLLGKGDFLNQLFLNKNTKNKQSSLELKGTKGNQGLTNMESSIAVAKTSITKEAIWKVGGKYYGVGMDIDNTGDEGDKLMVDPGGINPLRNFWIQYVTWGWIEDVLITSNIGYVASNPSSIAEYPGAPNGNWKDISPKIYSGDINVPTQSGMNRNNTTIRNYNKNNGPKLESQDPLICQLPPFKLDISGWETKGQARHDGNFRPTGWDTGRGSMDFNVDDTGAKGYLRNILVNVFWIDKIYQKHKGKGRVVDLVKDLLEGINGACGNIWNFDVITDDTHQCLRVIDSGVPNKMPDKPVFMFKPYTSGSMVRSIDISTNVSEKLKGSIMAGQAKSNAKAGEKGKSGGDDTSAYSYFGAKIKDLSIKDVENANSKKAVIEPSAGTVEGEVPNPSKILLEAYKDLGGDRSPESVSGAKAAWRGYLDSLEPGTDEEPQTKELILPLNLSLEIDGIEGLAWGNSIGISYLPTRYKDRCKFRVTKVSQKVDASGWTTKVQTQFMVRK